MHNVLTVAELKRRGMAAIEEHLRRGPVHILKRNKPAAVVLSEEDYQRLTGSQPNVVPGLSALQWLLTQPATGTRSKQEIDEALIAERDW
jgi:hypothetical protein